MTRPLLPHRVPGRPDLYYVKASDGVHLHKPGSFTILFSTRRALAQYLAQYLDVPAEAIR